MALNKKILQRWHNSDLVLIGGSAGSFKPVFNVVKNFPDDFHKPVVIIMHRKKNFFSEIEKMFSDNSRLPFREIADKDPVKDASVYMAPANYHVLIEKDKSFSLDVSDAVWYSKPSIDVTFESAADIYQDRCAGILLSGANQDGAAGLLKLRNYGALTIVQDPKEAEMDEMPQAALNLNAAEYILSNNELFELLQTK